MFKRRWEALTSIRLNYTRRGTLRWLIAQHKRFGMRGWQRVWKEPDKVIAEQHAFAEGAFA